MVKLTSYMALSTLIIAPTFASELGNSIETRDVAESYLFGRDMEGLFAREQDFELPDLVRRFRLWKSNKAEEKPEMEGLLRRDNARDYIPHDPFKKHELVELPERDSDQELSIRDVIDDDLFERFYDDLD